MVQSKSEEQLALEKSYIAWMAALKGAFDGHQRKMHPLILEVLPRGPERDYFRTDNGKKVFDSWFNSAKLPTGKYAELIDGKFGDLASQHLKGQPESTSELPLPEVMKKLREVRAANQAQARKQSNIAVELYQTEVLKYEATKVKDLNEIDLQLGSAVFEGKLPPYCERDVDSQIISALNDQNRKIVVVVGPPKSGKTRTLIEGLKSSNLAENTVYWLNSMNQGSVNALAKAIATGRLVNPVVMLDDLQRFEFEGPGAISRTTFRLLLSASKIVATLHAVDAAEWKLVDLERSSGTKWGLSTPSKEVSEAFLSSSINLSQRLSADELARAESVYASLQDKQQLRHLASYFSSTEYFLLKAKRIQASNNAYDFAFLEALISAKIIWPSGIALEKIRSLFESELKSTTNLPWLEAEWERVVMDFAMGVTSNSPHALMVRTSKNREFFELFDGVWPHIRPAHWKLKIDGQNLSLREIASIGLAGYVQECIRILKKEEISDVAKHGYLGYFYRSLKDYKSSEEHILKGIEQGDESAVNELGLLYEEMQRFPEAVNCFLKAIEIGITIAENNLGNVYRAMGNFAQAEKHFLNAIQKGDHSAYNNVGLLHHDLKRYGEAEVAFLKAIDHGDSHADNNLGLLLQALERYEEAETRFKIAINKGDKEAPNNLGRLFVELKRFDEAETQYVKVLDTGDSRARLGLGFLFYEQANYSQAATCFGSALAEGSLVAHLYLGNTYFKLNRFTEAERHYLQAIENGETFALISIAKLYCEFEKFDDSELYCQKAIESGEAEGLIVIGILRAKQNRLEEAEEYFTSAIKQGNPNGLANMGVLQIIKRNFDQAESYFRKAVENGDKSALLNLGNLLYKLDRWDEAEAVLLRCVEIGESRALEGLANVYGALGRGVEAELFQRKYLDAMSKINSAQAGVTFEIRY
ncbi:MAG: hypothetical protein RL196_306 [Actinomycetota bacterium]